MGNILSACRSMVSPHTEPGLLVSGAGSTVVSPAVETLAPAAPANTSQLSPRPNLPPGDYTALDYQHRPAIYKYCGCNNSLRNPAPPSVSGHWRARNSLMRMMWNKRELCGEEGEAVRLCGEEMMFLAAANTLRMLEQREIRMREGRG